MLSVTTRKNMRLTATVMALILTAIFIYVLPGFLAAESPVDGFSVAVKLLVVTLAWRSVIRMWKVDIKPVTEHANGP